MEAVHNKLRQAAITAGDFGGAGGGQRRDGRFDLVLIDALSATCRRALLLPDTYRAPYGLTHRYEKKSWGWIVAFSKKGIGLTLFYLIKI